MNMIYNVNGKKITKEEYERREKEKRDKQWAEYKKWNKKVSELKEGDKIKFEYGDFDNFVFMEVRRVNGFKVFGKVIKSSSVDYPEGEICSVDFMWDRNVALVDDEEINRIPKSEEELITEMLNRIGG